MKCIDDYNIPIEYKNEIHKFYNYLMEKYKTNILLFTLSGSTVFEDIREEISDIDLIIILKKCSSEVYEDIYSYKNKFKIKIDCNIFVSSELKNKHIDYIAMYYLYLIKIKYIEPIYFIKEFKNSVTKKNMLNSIRNVVILNARTFRKIVYEFKPEDTNIIIKNIIYLEKDYLILKDNYCSSSEDVIKTFNNKFNLLFDLDLIKCLKNELDELEIRKLLDYANRLIMIFNEIKY